MSNVQQGITPALERLTWAEICERYPDEWVVLVETEWTDEDSFEFDHAVVLGHGKSHKEVLRRTISPDGGPSFGIYFTGRVRAPTPRFVLP